MCQIAHFNIIEEKNIILPSVCLIYWNTLEEIRQNDILTKKEIISLSKPSLQPKEMLDLIFHSNMFRRRWFLVHHRDPLVYFHSNYWSTTDHRLKVADITRHGLTSFSVYFSVCPPVRPSVQLCVFLFTNLMQQFWSHRDLRCSGTTVSAIPKGDRP